MEQRISLVTLGVGDLDRSREFYERLGWKRSVKDAPGIVFFQAGGIGFSLYPRADLARDANLYANIAPDAGSGAGAPSGHGRRPSHSDPDHPTLGTGGGCG